MSVVRSLVLTFLLYAIGLWGMSIPLTGDQKTYLSIAIEMREKGEWIIPYLFGDANFLKPPLQYWATLLSWKVFGISLWGALLPSVLALMGSMFALVRVYHYFAPRSKVAALPGLVLAATLGTMTYATTAQMEIWIVLFYLWAWVFLLEKKILRAWVLVGVMAWIKGPLYSVLCGASFILFEGSRIKNTRHVLGALLGVVLGMGWFLMAARTHQNDIIRVFFLQENMQKIGGNRGSPASLWGEFLYSLMPILFYLFHLAFVTRKVLWSRMKQNGVGWWMLCFSLLPAVFFTFFPYRVNTYLFILTPIIAVLFVLLSECFLIKANQTKQEPLKNVGLWLSFLTATIMCVLLFRLSAGHWILPAVAVALVVIVWVWVWMHYRQHALGVVVTSICMVNLIRIAAVGLGEHDLSDLRNYLSSHSVTNIAYRIEDRDIWHEFGLVSAALGRPIERIFNAEDEQKFLSEGGLLILQPDQALPGSVANINIHCVSWIRFQKRMKFPLQELIKTGLSVEDARVIRQMQLCQREGT